MGSFIYDIRKKVKNLDPPFYPQPSKICVILSLEHPQQTFDTPPPGNHFLRFSWKVLTMRSTY